MQKDQEIQQQLAHRFQTEYQHLHHAHEHISNMWKMVHDVNPNQDPVERFNMVMSQAEKMFPNKQAPPPSFPTGGQAGGSGAYRPPSNQMNTRMINGFPVRETSQAAQDLNDYMYERKQAFNRRSNSPTRM